MSSRLMRLLRWFLRRSRPRLLAVLHERAKSKQNIPKCVCEEGGGDRPTSEGREGTPPESGLF